jgi:uncharacterized protein YndB with AHSA1/START domain
MPVLSSEIDRDALTLTFVAEFDGSVDRVWQLWEDPRQLERWWGPPTWPATFERHDFTEGGESRYYMTGPEGEKARGWWKTTLIDEPRRIEFADGFSNDDGEPAPGDPIKGVVTFEEINSGTRFTIVSTFGSPEYLNEVLGMGMEEGMRGALNQIDGLLADARQSH